MLLFYQQNNSITRQVESHAKVERKTFKEINLTCFSRGGNGKREKPFRGRRKFYNFVHNVTLLDILRKHCRMLYKRSLHS